MPSTLAYVISFSERSGVGHSLVRTESIPHSAGPTMNQPCGIVLAWLLLVASASAAPMVNAKDHGARGDGSTDDTAAMQKSVSAVAGTGGTLLVPPGVYMIDASRGVLLQSQMSLTLESGAVLRAIPNDLKNSRVVLVNGVESVNISGGTIEGERDAHLGTTGEWGNGIEIRNSKNISIDRVAVRKKPGQSALT